MTMSGYSSAIVDVMLGWLKGLANWVLRLFNLAGSVTTSPLLWLSRNWMKLLIVFLVLGVVLDRLIWLIRWRPYWVWFKKERVIVNDDKFFASADMDKAPNREKDLDENWDEHDYVVASTVVRRQNAEKREGVERGERGAGNRRAARPQSRRRTDARVKRQVERKEDAPQKRAVDNPDVKRTRPEQNDNIFATKLNKPKVSDVYEDEVFNVSNLPTSSDYDDTADKRGDTDDDMWKPARSDTAKRKAEKNR